MRDRIDKGVAKLKELVRRYANISDSIPGGASVEVEDLFHPQLGYTITKVKFRERGISNSWTYWERSYPEGFAVLSAMRDVVVLYGDLGESVEYAEAVRRLRFMLSAHIVDMHPVVPDDIDLPPGTARCYRLVNAVRVKARVDKSLRDSETRVSIMRMAASNAAIFEEVDDGDDKDQEPA